MNETITKRKDGRYELKLTIKNHFGQKERKSFYGKTKREAKEKKEEWLKLYYNDNVELNNNIGFTKWADIWLKEYKHGNVRDSTYEFNYKAKVEKYLKPYFRNRPLQSITPVDIQSFFNSNKTLSLDLLKTLRVVLNGIFSTAIDNEICVRNPVSNVVIKSTQKKEEKTILNAEQQSKAIDWAIKNNRIDILTVIKTGMRRGELLGLKWEDIDFDSLIISINESVAPKLNNQIDCELKTMSSRRKIPIDKDLADKLKELPRLSNRVFNCTNANAYGKRIAIQLKKMSEECNIPLVTLHGLRHTCGTVLKENGVDIYTISKLLGHSNVGITTKIYIHNDVEVMRRAIFGV